MQHRILFVHGIGVHPPGWSKEWQAAFNHDLRFQPSNYLEVTWDTVFQVAQGGTRAAAISGAPVTLTPQEQVAADQVREELATILQARATAIQPPMQAITRSGPGTIEYGDLQRAPTTRGALDWLFQPDAYIGDFAKYLVSRNVRTAVKEKVKEQLRPLAGSNTPISIIAHSWGTVVSYDSLLDLQVELPNLKVVNLFTLGSPLWAVRSFLDDRSGRKPGQLTNWVNIHARGDLVGSWLQPAFKDDKDFEVPSFGNVGAHSSYFVANNEAVQRDIVAQYVLR